VAVVVAFLVQIFFHLFDPARSLIDRRAKRSRFDIDDDRNLSGFGEGDDVGFHIFHTHRIAPNRQKARFIFAISETIFVDVLVNERLNFAL
jgi:hypothetical protein